VKSNLGLVRLEGGCNFRQISGQSTHDGRRVRAGKLFRSGVLAYFSAADHAQLAALHIRTIMDLRSTDERRREPTRWCSEEVRTLCVDDETAPASLLRMALKTGSSEATMRRAMVETYRAMPMALADRLRILFASLLRGDTPLLVHCSAGKDRTGFAIATVLDALGVARDNILQDYLYTNEAVDLEGFVLRNHPGAQRNPETKNPVGQLPADIRSALLGAHAEYLQAALAELDETYGSIEGYLEHLDIDTEQLRHMRDHLLE
jgi:protein-tyrosine phosphatase